jgi:hypothetical protein
MKLHAVWTGILYVFDLITLSPERSKPLPEAPLPAVSVSNVPTPVSKIPHKFDDDTPLPPIVGVPRREGAFECPYPDMIDFENCHGPGSRGCWLYNPDTGEEYNITTDYDDPTKVPKGIVREVNKYSFLLKNKLSNFNVESSSGFKYRICQLARTELLWSMARSSTVPIQGLGLVSLLASKSKNSVIDN